MARKTDCLFLGLPVELQLYIFELASTSEYTIRVEQYWVSEGGPLLNETEYDDQHLEYLRFMFEPGEQNNESEEEKSYLTWTIYASPLNTHPETDYHMRREPNAPRPHVPTVCRLQQVSKYIKGIVKENGILQKCNQLRFTSPETLMIWLLGIGESGRNVVSSLYLEWYDGSDYRPNVWIHLVKLLRTCNSLLSLVVNLTDMSDWFMNLQLDNSIMKDRLGKELHLIRGLRHFAIVFDEDKFKYMDRYMYEAVDGVGLTFIDQYYIDPMMQKAFFKGLDDYGRELGEILCSPRIPELQVTKAEIADAQEFAADHDL